MGSLRVPVSGRGLLPLEGDPGSAPQPGGLAALLPVMVVPLGSCPVLGVPRFLGLLLRRAGLRARGGLLADAAHLVAGAGEQSEAGAAAGWEEEAAGLLER